MTTKDSAKPYGDGGSMLYCLGLLGAIVYYFQAAEGFMAFVTGFFKALVWPAIVVYHLLDTLV